MHTRKTLQQHVQLIVYISLSDATNRPSLEIKYFRSSKDNRLLHLDFRLLTVGREGSILFNIGSLVGGGGVVNF